MGQTDTRLYSRPVHNLAMYLAAGDMLNIAINHHVGGFCWQEVTGVDVVTCENDESQDDAEEPCDGQCICILTMKVTEPGDLATIHVQRGEEMVWARLLADTTAAQVEQENEDQAAAYQALCKNAG